MYCLLVVLVKLSLHAKWLARKTHIRKPNCGEGIISIKPRPKRAYDCVGSLYSFVILLHDIFVLPPPCEIHFLLLWHDIGCLCWKCRKKQTNYSTARAQRPRRREELKTFARKTHFTSPTVSDKECMYRWQRRYAFYRVHFRFYLPLFSSEWASNAACLLVRRHHNLRHADRVIWCWRSVCLSVCQSVCVGTITRKVLDGFRRRLWCHAEELLTRAVA